MIFDLHQPQTLPDALSLADRHGESARFLAGGTDLVIQMRRGRLAPRHLVDLSGLRDLAGIEETAEGFAIGTLTTHKMIERHPPFLTGIPMLAEAARVVGGHQVRNVGTVGGNVVNASPAADVVAPLLALDASLQLESSAGRRSVGLGDFLLGPGRTVLRSGEMLTWICFARPPAASGSAFLKAGRRKAMEISVACVAVSLSFDGQRCRTARIALGAVGPTTLRAREAEAALEGRTVDPDLFREAGRIASGECRPISDVRASAEYRRILVGTLVERALLLCLSRRREVAP